MPTLKQHEDNDMLFFLAMQIEESDCWNMLLGGLNEKGQNDLIDFVHAILYTEPDK